MTDLNSNSRTSMNPGPGAAGSSRAVGTSTEVGALGGPGTAGRIFRGAGSFLQGQVGFILLLLLLAAGSVLSPVFLTPRNLYNILWATSVLGVVALGQTVLILTNNFDISVSMVVSFAGITCVGAQIAGLGLWPSIVIGLLTGIAVGALNGAIVVITKANPFLVTLGTQTLVYAIALIATNATTWYAKIPEFNVLGQGVVFGFLHYSVIIFVVLAILIELFLRHTPSGHYLFVLGANEEAGRRCGIKVQSLKLWAFIFCGFTAALAGLILTSRLNSTRASGAAGIEFDSIIAVVLGGTSLFGGSGGALRTMVGVMVLGILNNVMVLVGARSDVQFIAKGVVFLLVVGIDAFFRRRP
jgi:ribose transport system permease protein